MQEYYRWSKNKTDTREVEKPNATGKLWKRFTKRPTDNLNHITLPKYSDKSWLKIFIEITEWSILKKLSILRLHFNDPTITSIERIKLKTLIGFISFKYPQLKIHSCYNSTTELTLEERERIISESHGSIMSQHFGENKSRSRIYIIYPRHVK